MKRRSPWERRTDQTPTIVKPTRWPRWYRCGAEEFIERWLPLAEAMGASAFYRRYGKPPKEEYEE